MIYVLAVNERLIPSGRPVLAFCGSSNPCGTVVQPHITTYISKKETTILIHGNV